MTSRVLLVRHPPVARAWSGRCYGSSDMGWSREGIAMAHRLAGALTVEPLALVVHSGLRRTERLARMIADRTGATLHRDERWRERDFGSWEGRSWGAIWRETGSLMDRMMTDPNDFRPGGGETTAELIDRSIDAWLDLPPVGNVIVIGHGGSIAAVRAHCSEPPGNALADLIPASGAIISVDRSTRSSFGR